METALLLTLLVNLTVTGLNILSDFNLKKKDERLLILQIKGNRKLDVCENAYKTMKIIQYNFLSSGNIEDQTDRINKLKRDVNLGEIYLSNRARRVISDFCDYAIGVVGDKNRDFEKEKIMFVDFEEEYMR